jgi:3-deoxy-7-phosphoheptulonate synthase
MRSLPQALNKCIVHLGNFLLGAGSCLILLPRFNLFIFSCFFFLRSISLVACPSLSLFRSYSTKHQPFYSDDSQLKDILFQLHNLPPLVTVDEVDQLKTCLAQVGLLFCPSVLLVLIFSSSDQAEDGKAFILQGGDCAERFVDCTESYIKKTLTTLFQMSVLLASSLKVPVGKAYLRLSPCLILSCCCCFLFGIVRIGRMAGQYGKPRTSETETLDSGHVVPVFKGAY